MNTKLKFNNQSQSDCANNLITLIEDTIGVAKVKAAEKDNSLTIFTQSEIDEYNAQWIRRWIRKEPHCHVFSQEKQVYIDENQIKLYFQNEVKIK